MVIGVPFWLSAWLLGPGGADPGGARQAMVWGFHSVSATRIDAVTTKIDTV